MLLRSIISVIAAAALTASLPAQSVASSTGASDERTVAGARAFAKLTVQAQRELAQAKGRAERAGEAARDAGAQCLDSWRAVPPRHRAELFDFYFFSVAAGFFKVDGTVFSRWVNRLGTTPSIGRVTTLRRARRDLRASLRVIKGALPLAADACSSVRKWEAGGFREDSRPTELVALRRVAKEFEALGSANLTAAAGLVQRRGGRLGGRAAELIADGIDEPDDRVLIRCDPVVAIIEPEQPGSEPGRCPAP